ncbi:MAG: phospholipase D-like domain-containing protein [Sphingobacteriales bacterium]
MSRPSSSIKSSYTYNNRVTLIHGGKDYFDMVIELIRRAEKNIHLQTYIFDGDETGTMVADALKEAASRGVEVYMLLDGYASRQLPMIFIDELKSKGVKFRFFEPLLKSERFYFGRRLHHKLLVVDQQYALVGGINISNRYNDMPGQQAWLDWAVLTEGESSQELYKVCLSLWFKSKAQAKAMLRLSRIAVFPVIWDCAVKVRRNDWVRKLNQISRSYINMFNDAEHHVWIMSSYFLPGRQIRHSIIRALKRGITIRVILAGTSDVPIAKYAERYIYRWLIRQGVKIYEYPRCVLHAKVSCYDGKWVTIGSYNVNNISAYASVELNLDIRKRVFAQEVESRIKKIVEEDCIEITREDLKRYSLIQHFMQWVSYEIYRLVLFLFTFYFSQKPKS